MPTSNTPPFSKIVIKSPNPNIGIIFSKPETFVNISPNPSVIISYLTVPSMFPANPPVTLASLVNLSKFFTSQLATIASPCILPANPPVANVLISSFNPEEIFSIIPCNNKLVSENLFFTSVE